MGLPANKGLNMASIILLGLVGAFLGLGILAWRRVQYAWDDGSSFLTVVCVLVAALFLCAFFCRLEDTSDPRTVTATVQALQPVVVTHTYYTSYKLGGGMRIYTPHTSTTTQYLVTLEYQDGHRELVTCRNSLFQWKWDSKDTFLSLRQGTTYQLHLAGWHGEWTNALVLSATPVEGK